MSYIKGDEILSKIILLNAGKYQKAIITLDMETIQIVGKNNIGKTSLLSVLNFLYAPDKNDWNFDHDAKTTLNYYFKSLDKHYILFEIYKNSYFSILLFRNDNNELEYYKIDAPYDEIEKDFFNERKALLSFEDVSSNLLSKITKLSKPTFRELIFGKSKNDKTVLWLNSESNPRQFSKIYKYLLNTKLINNERLKESLLIADKKLNEKREFNISDSKHIEEIKKHQNSINTLSAVKDDFLKFRELVSEYNSKNTKLKTDYYAFRLLYENETKELHDKSKELGDEIDNIKNVKQKPLEEKNQVLQKEFGGIESDIKHKIKEYESKNKRIDAIQSYEPLNFLKATYDNLKKEKDDLNYKLSQIKNEDYTKESIESLIRGKSKTIDELKKQISNFNNLLIHHISDDIEIKQILNNVFSNNVLKLDKSSIKGKVTNIDERKILEVFDGKIDILDVDEKEFISLEKLDKSQIEATQDLKKYQEIQENIKNIETIKNKVLALEIKISDIDSQIKEVESLPKLLEELEKIGSERNALIETKDNIIIALKKNKKDLVIINKILDETSEKLDKKQDRLREINTYYTHFEDELKQLSLNFDEQTNLVELDTLYDSIRQLKDEVYQLKIKKDTLFIKLKEKLLKEHASEHLFIQEVNEELMSMQNKENSVNSLIDSISNDISKPTKEFLTKLDEFESYIKSISRKFKKYKISDLDSVEVVLHRNEELIKDLTLISTIKKENLLDMNNEFNPSHQIKILRDYIENEKVVHLSDLFDIKFLVNSKNVNMSKQTESNGTDRILKITLFLVIMQDLLIDDKDNKLVIYVDELGEVDDDNLFEFINRCKENNFLPIFAGPDKKPHIAKYYDLLALDNKQIVVDENRAIYVKDRV